MTKHHVCPECGQTIKDAHKETLSKSKLSWLEQATLLVQETGINAFKMRDIGSFATNPTAYNNFQKLRYHKLIDEVRVDGKKQRGVWYITKTAQDFLAGQRQLPKFVIVEDNVIIEEATELVDYMAVKKTAPFLETTFEYFDKAGNSLGTRPEPAAYQPDAPQPKAKQSCLIAIYQGNTAYFGETARFEKGQEYELLLDQPQIGQPITVTYNGQRVGYKDPAIFKRNWQIVGTKKQ